MSFRRKLDWEDTAKTGLAWVVVALLATLACSVLIVTILFCWVGITSLLRDHLEWIGVIL